MMTALIHMDGKSRIVIPKRMRERLGIQGRTPLLLYAFEGILFARVCRKGESPLLDALMRGLHELEGD